MQSQLSQRIKKGSLKRFGPDKLWSPYRQRLEPLDTVFGRENVTLRKFDANALKGGDVVEDFLDFAGISLPPDGFKSKNISPSLEALALLYTHNKFGQYGHGSLPNFWSINKQLVSKVSAVGRKKILLSPELVQPILEDNSADLEWTERRMSVPLNDFEAETSRPGPRIGSEDDLLAIAEWNFPALERVFPDPPAQDSLSVHENIARKLDHFIVENQKARSSR